MRRFIPGREELDKSRTEAFTDGVFAIAITLLVLEIHIPDFSAPTNGQLVRYLASLGGPLVTYALSFATVGIIWLNHNATHARMRHIDRTGNALNMLLLAIVCFLPFPTALLSRYGPLPATTAFYGATFTAMSIAYGLDWIYGATLQHRREPQVFPPITVATALPGAIGTFFYAAGTIVSLWAPRAAVGMFIAVTVYYMLPGLFSRHHRAEAAA